MLALIALFEDLDKSCGLSGKAQADIEFTFDDWQKRLLDAKSAVAYYAGNNGAGKPALAIKIEKITVQGNKAVITVGKQKPLDIKSGEVSAKVFRAARQSAHLNKEGHAPLVYFLPKAEFRKLMDRADLAEKARALIEAGDYKGVCMMFAPLKTVRSNEIVWNSAELLYWLGLSCSKLAVTLKIKAAEKKRLEEARRYRSYCTAFLRRGAALEAESSRCATALAYRYYSNVHELMRPGERRDQDLSEQIDKAHEWLSRAIEIYPDSIRNHYRKGKLIIEKQAPYLLFGKRAFGSREAELLREIREVGEEHLATAITLYEALENEEKKQRDRREYAKALFVLGGYYLDDAYLPVHEYYIALIAQGKADVSIPTISLLNLQSALDMFEKCFAAESDLKLDKLDTRMLAAHQKDWTRAPVEKLYRLGCVHSALSFIARAAGRGDELKKHIASALYFLDAAAKTALYSEEKRSTWHISEKLAWTHIHAGNYKKAAALLARAKQGYIVNTRAIALLLCGTGEAKSVAIEALKAAARDKANLALGLTRVLLAYMGADGKVLPETLSAKNKRLARIAGAAVKN
ncbi:MAG: hypothetical protein WDA65_07495 [Christensenellales bacterium]